jgi:hypothetical protein
METNEKYCQKCKFYIDNECKTLEYCFKEMMINDFTRQKYDVEKLKEKYFCPFKTEIFLENLNQE